MCHDEKHPRLRGEDSAQTRGGRTAPETPPLARGRQIRSISHSSLKWKHPRLRGEDRGKVQSDQKSRETPPLARGRLRGCRVRRGLNRNTPACAGKTSRLTCGISRRKKHPRLRGEDLKPPRIGTARRETPPLARGRHKCR